LRESVAKKMDTNTLQAAKLWTLAQPVVSAFIASVVHDFKDRDDVLQEIAVAVIESFPSYDASRPFNAWAIGVARNQVGLYLRKRRRDRLVFDEKTIDCLAATFRDVTPEDSHRLDRLRECLQSIQGRAWELCKLRYEKDLKPAAIAERFGMTANSVAKALQRTREQLRACIETKTSMEGANS
jgi:RNA polymerase sigma-70 factor (ECF subfamily)